MIKQTLITITNTRALNKEKHDRISRVWQKWWFSTPQTHLRLI